MPELTIEEACAVLNEAGYRNRRNHEIQEAGDHRWVRSSNESGKRAWRYYDEADVIAIAQGIRDRARIVELEAHFRSECPKAEQRYTDLERELAQVTAERDALKDELEGAGETVAVQAGMLRDEIKAHTALRDAVEPLVTNRGITVLYERLTIDWRNNLDDPVALPRLDGHQIVALVEAYQLAAVDVDKEGNDG